MRIYNKVVVDIDSGKKLSEDSFEYRGPLALGAAGPWKVYSKAKKIIGTGGLAMSAGGITLGVGVFKMCLLRQSATALGIASTSTRSTWTSLAPDEISALGGYVAHGRNLNPATGTWTLSANTCTFRYASAGLVFTASNASLKDIRFAVIRTSISATGGKLLCFCTLSTAQFSITSPNTLTILPAATGVFTLA